MRSKIIAVAACALLAGCTVSRMALHYLPNIDDHKFFVTEPIAPSTRPFTFHEGPKSMRDSIGSWIWKLQEHPDGADPEVDTVDVALGKYLAERTETTAFLVIRGDSILFEEYYRGYDRTKISQMFSATKSVTGLLTGIAVREGAIESVHDPVTKYIPELAKKDPHYQRLTIEHLLDMRSGFRFSEVYNNPFSKIGFLYYGTNRLGKMKRMKFAGEPGEWPEGDYNYQSATTALLGLVVERATGRNLAGYLAEKVWEPMGMENAASWSLDDRRHRAAKADCGLNTTARDLAKIGRLYLHGGNWNGTQIVDSEWVERTITPNPEKGGYQYQWYSHWLSLVNSKREDRLWDNAEEAEKAAARGVEKHGCSDWWVYDEENGSRLIIYFDSFYAFGLMGQIVYVDPAKDLIMVRLGEEDDASYDRMFYDMAKIL